ncbi:hypothetical protein [Pseudorhodobacter turbinis]|nr:hypothetical protein [Pseudorhodobacter turbinis]
MANLPRQSAKDFRFKLWRIKAKSEKMGAKAGEMSKDFARPARLAFFTI